MTLARSLPPSSDVPVSAQTASAHPPPHPHDYLSAADRRPTTVRTRASRALSDAQLLGATYQALIETYRQLCADRRKILEELIRWMDGHGGPRRRAPRDEPETGPTE